MTFAPEAGVVDGDVVAMQVTTSCIMRRAGSWNSTSLVTTLGTRIAVATFASA